VVSGKILDFAVEKCIDSEGNQRCSKPFLVTRDTCYQVEWSTVGALSHTTVEVRDAGSDEIVYYRDTNGEWTADKGEVSAGGERGRAGCADFCSWCTSISSRRSGSKTTRRWNIRLRRASEKLGRDGRRCRSSIRLRHGVNRTEYRNSPIRHTACHVNKRVASNVE
jgi:hypothetical protein